MLAALAQKTSQSTLLAPHQASVACTKAEKVSLTAIVTALGVGSGNCNGGGIQESLNGALACAARRARSLRSGAAITVSSVVVHHPPSPPPGAPLSPASPPSPPTLPPSYPYSPPRPPATWLEPYTDGDCLIAPKREGVGCPYGCQRMKWSETSMWDGQREEIGGGLWPSLKANVTIKPCHTVVLDVNLQNVQLYSLVIWGTLIVENRADANVVLRTTCITIKPGGRLLAGRPSPELVPSASPVPAYTLAYPAGSLQYLGAGPFLGKLEILLSGDDLTAAPQCGGFSGRKLINEGHLALHGARPAVVWSLLRHSAPAGAWKLTVQGDAGWLPGDVVMIASTGDSEAEARAAAARTFGR